MLYHKSIFADCVVGNNVQAAGGATVCNCSPSRDDECANPVVKSWYKGEMIEHKGKYGAYIGDGTRMGAYTIVMPGAYIEENSRLIGQCSAYGNNKVRSFVK